MKKILIIEDDQVVANVYRNKLVLDGYKAEVSPDGEAGLPVMRMFVPDLIIYLAGADPHEGDRLGRLKLTFAGMAARDRMVLDYAFEREIPVVITMAGGYGKNIQDTVAVHVQTIAIAAQYGRNGRTDSAV